jgi:hypothetical protein
MDIGSKLIVLYLNITHITFGDTVPKRINAMAEKLIKSATETANRRSGTTTADGRRASRFAPETRTRGEDEPMPESNNGTPKDGASTDLEFLNVVFSTTKMDQQPARNNNNLDGFGVVPEGVPDPDREKNPWIENSQQ